MQCKPDCPNQAEAIRLVLDIADLAMAMANKVPLIQLIDAAADIVTRAKAITPCPHCHPQPPPAPKAP